MHRLHFKYEYYDYQAAILENQIRAITPELMARSTPNFNHGYIYLLGIFYGFFTRGEHYGPGHFISPTLLRLDYFQILIIGVSSKDTYSCFRFDLIFKVTEVKVKNVTISQHVSLLTI
jgi:hypothetical protein